MLCSFFATKQVQRFWLRLERIVLHRQTHPAKFRAAVQAKLFGQGGAGNIFDAGVHPGRGTAKGGYLLQIAPVDRLAHPLPLKIRVHPQQL